MIVLGISAKGDDKRKISEQREKLGIAYLAVRLGLKCPKFSSMTNALPVEDDIRVLVARP